MLWGVAAAVCNISVPRNGVSGLIVSPPGGFRDTGSLCTPAKSMLLSVLSTDPENLILCAGEILPWYGMSHTVAEAFLYNTELELRFFFYKAVAATTSLS